MLPLCLAVCNNLALSSTLWNKWHRKKNPLSFGLLQLLYPRASPPIPSFSICMCVFAFCSLFSYCPIRSISRGHSVCVCLCVRVCCACVCVCWAFLTCFQGSVSPPCIFHLTCFIRTLADWTPICERRPLDSGSTGREKTSCKWD